MAAGTCEKCGGMTNSAVSDWDYSRKVAKGCYATFNEETREWSRGCVYDQVDPVLRDGADSVIASQPHKQR